jgi:hypothetical protein
MKKSTLLLKSILLLLIFVATGWTSLEAAPFDVKFLRVHAAQVSNNVVVRWVTDSEFDNEFFTVQRSTNGGMDWKDLGMVPGSGITPGSGNYQFWDEAPVTGNIAYRIRQTDMDGSYDYSWKVDITILPFAAEEPVELLAYPNPTDNIVIVDGEFDEVKLTDVTGKEVAVYLDNNGYNIRLRPIQKISGMYFLFLIKGEKTTIEKIKFN